MSFFSLFLTLNKISHDDSKILSRKKCQNYVTSNVGAPIYVII